MKKNKINKIVAILFAAFIVYTIFYIINKNKRLKESGIYSIATIYKITGAKGGLRIFIYFVYKGDTVRSDFIDGTDKYGEESIGRRYFIKFTTAELGNNISFINQHPPDSVQAPKDGWKQLPDY